MRFAAIPYRLYYNYDEREDRKRDEEALIQLELPLPELLEQVPSPEASGRGVYQDALKSVIDDAMEDNIVQNTTFKF